MTMQIVASAEIVAGAARANSSHGFVTANRVKVAGKSGRKMGRPIVERPLAKPIRRAKCPYGHAYTPDNVYVDKRGLGSCRKCRADRNAMRGKPTTSPRPKRTNHMQISVSIPIDYLADLDAHAAKAQMSRSQWLVQASRHFAVKVFGP